ncbi:MAG: hypothetical protein Q4C31_03150 [Eubacteriales bacterium]|nr:hypothetical protein [Eubacteriales bacterium]
MSGPKVSSYELEMMRREELRKKQEAELKRRLEEERRRRIEMNRQGLERCKTQAGRIAEELISKWKKLAERARVMQQAIDPNKISQLIDAANQLQKTFANSATLSENDENVTRCTQEFARIKSDSEKLLRYIQKEHEKFDEINRQAARKELNEMLAERQNQQEREKQQHKEAEALAQKIQAELDQLTDAFPVSTVQAINGVRSQLKNIQQHYKRSTAQQFNMLRDLNNHSLWNILRDADAWRALAPLRDHCSELCGLLKCPVPAQLNEMARENLVALEIKLQTEVETMELRRECRELFAMLNWEIPSSVHDLQKSQLKALRAQLNEKVLEQRSRAYVANAVEETMREMGYELAASKPGETEQEHLYTVHGNTMLKVKCQSNGNIAMSIGLGTDDSKHELSITEKASLVDDMTAFCTQYEEIQHKLGEKGVRLNRNLVLRPAEARYAQVFDITEFGLNSVNAGNNRRHNDKKQTDERRMYMRKE